MTFEELLRAVEDGKLLLQLDEEMAEVLKGVLRTGTKGELQLKIVFTPMDSEVHVTPKVTCKIPSAARRTCTFFVTMTGDLTRTPVQQPLFRERGAHA